MSESETPQKLVVEFTQQFTVKPPEEYTDPVHAEDWFWNYYRDIGYDVVEPEHKGNYEILHVGPDPEESESEI